jgi:ribonuclease VapC
MVVDTSALVAIALHEPSRGLLLAAMEAAKIRLISTMTLLESGMVLRARMGQKAVGLLYQFVDAVISEVVPFDEAQARLALAAFERYGKGMGHPAQLNFGDCAVYALAVSRGEPVLATGDDFSATDLPCYRF